MEVGSLLEAQRQRMQVMLDRYDYFRPGGGGRLAPLSFQEMVLGEHGVGNRFVEIPEFQYWCEKYRPFVKNVFPKVDLTGGRGKVNQKGKKNEKGKTKIIKGQLPS